MGHLRLGKLPATQKWNQVIELLDGGADARKIASAASEAAQAGFSRAKGDPGLIEAFWLLTQLPLAARAADFRAALGELGIHVESLTLAELVGSLSDALDARLLQKGRPSDLSEMAQLAIVETVMNEVGRHLPSLFSPSPGDVQVALASFATVKQFGVLARAYFSNFLVRYLTYYVSRHSSCDVGPNSPFASTGEHTEFNRALRRHCIETAVIIEKFAGEWFSKTNWERGISRARSREFSHVAFKKLGAELRRRDAI